MCGLTGFWQTSSKNNYDLSSVLNSMVNVLYHRGPDDGGVWIDPKIGLALGHRRLSILDLSSKGHQPMLSSSGRYVIIFNGEIYNHKLLRESLNGFRWRGHSDTETLLAGFETWGIEATLKKIIGMFAIILFDKKSNSLTLMRDRCGEKPIYYGWQSDTLLFSSELKSIKLHPSFKSEVDRNSISLFLRKGYISSPFSIYKGIHKLTQGAYVTIPLDIDINTIGKLPEPIFYWSLSEVALNGINKQFKGDDTDAIDYLDKLLSNSISLQMLSDVPVGAFLSGGIDSSTIVALMQAQSKSPINTFSIGFVEDGYNEAKKAKSIAGILGTSHNELYINSRDARNVIELLPSIYDEPFSDPSQIPTYLLSKFVREDVTVSLSGDGGDELFGGYKRYSLTSSIWKIIGWMDLPQQKFLAKIIKEIPKSSWSVFSELKRFFPGQLQSRLTADRINKFADKLEVSNQEELYHKILSHWNEPSDILIDSIEPNIFQDIRKTMPYFNNIENMMMYIDTIDYLSNNILTKVDRASMSVSLEARVPLLDHRLIEFAWSLPFSMKIREGKGKWILRQLLGKYLPKEFIDTPKKGFSVPIGSWLRGPLRDWVENHLDESVLQNGGYFRSSPIRKMWQEHLTGQRNWQYHLWNILIFQEWLEGS